MSTVTAIEGLGLGAVVSHATAPGSADRTDHALLEATKCGDGDAFAELVSRYRNQITCYIYRMLDDYEMAVDLAQETFVRVYGAAARYQTNYAFSTYIYRIATNLAISEIRKRKRRRLVSLSAVFQRDDESEAREFNPPDPCALQDSELVAAERRAAVARAIGTLPEKYRAPLVLRDVRGLSYEEIASVLDTSVGTIKSRISRARAFLREKLASYF